MKTHRLMIFNLILIHSVFRVVNSEPEYYKEIKIYDIKKSNSLKTNPFKLSVPEHSETAEDENSPAKELPKKVFEEKREKQMKIENLLSQEQETYSGQSLDISFEEMRLIKEALQDEAKKHTNEIMRSLWTAKTLKLTKTRIGSITAYSTNIKVDGKFIYVGKLSDHLYKFYTVRFQGVGDLVESRNLILHVICDLDTTW